MKKFILLFILFLPLFSGAQLRDNGEEFLADDWSEGLHLFVGAGLNSSNYRSNTRQNYLGMGSNFKTDVGWYFNHDWAVELSATVKFNKFNGDVLWDTLLTLGGRYRIEDYYFRGFAGAGVLVIVLNEGEPNIDKDARRIHFDGPAIGLGFGKTRTTSHGKIWFTEINGSVQKFRRRNDVAIDGQYPIALTSESVNDNSIVYSAQFTIGVLLF